MNGRAWQYSDLSAIAALERECFSDPWNHRMLAESFLSGHFYGSLLEEDGAVAAYGGMVVFGEQAQVQLIGVAEMYRRCGRGGMILEDLISIAREKGVKHVFLEVRVSNSPALLLYLKHGFSGLYARSRYYADGEDAIVMVKELA